MGWFDTPLHEPSAQVIEHHPLDYDQNNRPDQNDELREAFVTKPNDTP